MDDFTRVDPTILFKVGKYIIDHKQMKKGLKMIAKLKIIIDLLKFLWKRKLWWIIPSAVILLGFGLLFVLAQSSGVAPFIYTLF